MTGASAPVGMRSRPRRRLYSVGLLVGLALPGAACSAREGALAVCSGKAVVTLTPPAFDGVRPGDLADSVAAHCSVTADSLAWNELGTDRGRVMTIATKNGQLRLDVDDEGVVRQLATQSVEFETTDGAHVGMRVSLAPLRGYTSGSIVEGQLLLTSARSCAVGLWGGSIGLESGTDLDSLEIARLDSTIVVRRLSLRTCMR